MTLKTGIEQSDSNASLKLDSAQETSLKTNKTEQNKAKNDTHSTFS